MPDIGDELKPCEDLLLPPMVFAAKNAVRLKDWANDTLWVASVKAYRSGESSRIFENICFFSRGSLAGIIGIESESGYPADFTHEAAIQQQEFIAFLREERRRKVESMGLFARCFFGWEFSVEAAATSSFMLLVEGLTEIALGYHDDDGNYKLVRVDASDWLDSARHTSPFDALP